MSNALAQALTEVSTTQKHDLGFKFEDKKTGKTYRYIQVHASGVALAIGDWAYRYAIATKFVCSATPESLLASVFVTGCAIVAVPVGSYAWVQTGGDNAKMKTNNASTGTDKTGYVAIPCSTSGGAKWVNAGTNTEYTNAMMPTIAMSDASETSTTSLGYCSGRIVLEGV